MYIKREDAIKAFMLNSKGERIPFVDCDNFPVEFPLRYIVDTLAALPSADRPQGEWVDMGDFEQCSVCKGTRLKEFQSYYGKTTWIKTPYCPNCGAKMKGADDE